MTLLDPPKLRYLCRHGQGLPKIEKSPAESERARARHHLIDHATAARNNVVLISKPYLLLQAKGHCKLDWAWRQGLKVSVITTRAFLQSEQHAVLSLLVSS